MQKISEMRAVRDNNHNEYHVFLIYNNASASC